MQILWPAFAMFALTACVVLRLGTLRAKALSGGRMSLSFYRLYRDDQEPADVAVVTRHFINLFEAPVLFYVAVIIAYVTGQSGAVPVALAWAYVAARGVHTWIHLGSNNVLWRFRVYGASWLILAALWVTLGLGIAGLL